MTPLQRVTGLDRGLDPRLPSNLFALMISLLAGAIVAVQRGSLIEVIASAGWVFASWALARELDPDQPLSAALASSAVMVTLLVLPEARGLALTGLSATGVLMIAARAGLNSTGRALKLGDELLIAAAPIVAQLLTGVPLGLLGIASLTALYLRRGTWWSMGLAALGIAGVFFSPARERIAEMPLDLYSLLSGADFIDTNALRSSALAALALLTVGLLGQLRRVPDSQNDSGGLYDPRAWRVLQAGLWAGAAVAALLSPPLIWGSLAVTGALALILERLWAKG